MTSMCRLARGFLFDGSTTAHVTAVLREKKTGRKWAVDAWTRGYGQAPEIMPLALWQTAMWRTTAEPAPTKSPAPEGAGGLKPVVNAA